MHNVKNRRERGKNNCHLNEKAEEDQKAAKEAAALYNAQIAGHRFHVTKQRNYSPRIVCRASISQRTSTKRHIFSFMGEQNTTAYRAQSTVE